MHSAARGDAPPLDVDVEIDSNGDDVAYDPATDTVRWDRRRTMSNRRAKIREEGLPPEPIYATHPFEEWAAIERERIARTEVDRVVTDAFSSAIGFTVGVGTISERDQRSVTITRGSVTDRDGAPVIEPEVSLEDLRSNSPSAITVTVTVTLEGRSRTEWFPVFLEEVHVREH